MVPRLPVRAVLLLALALTGAPALAQRPTAPAPTPRAPLHAWDTVAYNRRAILACHNCYEPESKMAPLAGALRDTRAVEIDAWRGPVPGRWHVAHGKLFSKDVDLSHSNCVAGSSTKGDLHACLRLVRDSLRSDHDVLTLFLDLKSGLEGGWNPAALDAALTSVFSRGEIYTPEDRRTAAAAVPGGDAGWWPTLEVLHGRVIVVLTGAGHVETYFRQNRRPVAFVAMPGKRAKDVAQTITGPGGDRVQFFNFGVKLWTDAEALNRVRGIRAAAEAGRVSRLWYSDIVGESAADTYARRTGACVHLKGELTFLAVFRKLTPITKADCTDSGLEERRE